MPGLDYIVSSSLDDAAASWQTELAPYERRQRTWGEPRHAALLVLDMQRFFTDPDSHAWLPVAAHVTPRICGLVRAFRDAGSPVLFTRHALTEEEPPGRMGDWWQDVVREGGPAAELAGGIGLHSSDTVIRKTRYDAFAGTPLLDLLRDAGVTTVVICGVMTHLCCETTARRAFGEGFHVLVAADGTASTTEELHVGALRALAHGFATIRTAGALADWRRQPPDRPDHEPPVAPRTTPRASTPPEAIDLAVVGAGPAGLSAAVQAVRHGLRVRLLEGYRPGGLLRQADLVENHLGSGWLPGRELVSRLVEHAARNGVAAHRSRVVRATLDSAGYSLDLEDGAPLRCRGLVLATGTAPLRAGLPGEESLSGQRLFDGVAELLEHHGGAGSGHVAIIGGGDAAFDQACQLRRRGWRVDLLLRGDRPRALVLLRRRARLLGVTVHPRTTVIDLAPLDDRLEITLTSADAPKTWRPHYLLTAVGRTPRIPHIVDKRQSDEGQNVQDPVDAAALPRLWVAGDVARGRFRQSAMAAGDGVEAAMKAAAVLEKT